MSALLSGIAEAALRAVLGARTLPEAHAAAREGLDALARGAPSDLLEVRPAAALAGVSESTLRRWAARHRRGRVPDWFAYRLGGRWIVDRPRFRAFVDGGA